MIPRLTAIGEDQWVGTTYFIFRKAMVFQGPQQHRVDFVNAELENPDSVKVVCALKEN